MKKLLIDRVISNLKQEYPKAKCSLNFENPLQMIIAARLSAQCTDTRVNKVTPMLFSKFKSSLDFSNADIRDIEKIIISCGLYKTKAKSIKLMCQKILYDFSDKLPDNIEDLTSLPGVGRKTANLVMGVIFNKPAIIVDTHVIKITKRLGIHRTKNARKIENILKKIIPENESTEFCHRLVMHGRKICFAHKPNCQNCCLEVLCPKLISLK